jgi:hypothetical protein
MGLDISSFPNEVLVLWLPCAPRCIAPFSTSQVVAGANVVVGSSTRLGTGPWDIHTTHPKFISRST